MTDSFPTSILIVKTSSLGDIIQSFVVLNALKARFPHAKIDWVVEAVHAPIVASHPLVSRVIPLDIKHRTGLWKGVQELRSASYDLIFDLQGNCKSGVITWLSIGKVKVGYDLRSVREWPNVLSTHKRFFVSKEQNIRLFYLGLIEAYCPSSQKIDPEGVCFVIENREQIEKILDQTDPSFRIMVCPGSQWTNKQLKFETLLLFLQKIEAAHHPSFLLVWGDEPSRQQCLTLQQSLQKAYVLEKLSIPVWQNLMNEMDLLIAVDSSALHLCATTQTPTFSIFGPTSANVFKPVGPQHVAFQGSCPYHQVFTKQCPRLRSCPTGACIRDLEAEEIFQALQKNTLLFTGGKKGGY